MIANPDAQKPALSLSNHHSVNTIFVFLNEEGQLTDEPRTLAEIMARPDWLLWKAAMDAKIAQLIQLGTYKLVNLPEGRKAIGCHWVFLIKHDNNGSILKYKACLVAQGFSQIPGQDFSATFASIMHLESFHALLAIAAVEDLKIHQMDVVGAYLNGELEDQLYMVQPPDYEDGSRHVCRLFKALYGLKQAGHIWNAKLNKVFCDTLGYIHLTAD